MAIWSDIATYIGPTVNHYGPGSMSMPLGVVLHIQDGSEAGTEAWQRNPASEVSSHFLAPRAGGLRQMVDTSTAAWAEVQGNLHWLSVECEGVGGQLLTDAQIEAVAQLLARAHRVYGVPLQICDSPLLPGLGGLTGHSLGGEAWGGHTLCPGDGILAQREAIVARAAAITGGTPAPTTPDPTPAEEEDDMPSFATGQIKDGFDTVTMFAPPPAGVGVWGDVHVSFGSDFADAHLRVAAYIHPTGWLVFDDVLVPAAADRVNPFGGPAPAGIQKVSVKRVQAPGDDATAAATPVTWLVEAAKH